MNRLANKVALITGGARGQGEAECRLFAAEGATVVVADVLADAGRQVAESIGGGARFESLNVADEQNWQRVVEGIRQREGGLDILINNAGILRRAPLLETPLEQYREVMEVNQIGCFLGMKVAGAALVQRGGGAIVNISSIAGFLGVPEAIAYTATKFAIRGMTRVAAAELGPKGIRVNSIHPGAIDTIMSRGEDFSAVDLDEVCRKQPIPRAGKPEEVADLALFLAGAESAFCSGGEYVIDGGFTACYSYE